MNPNISPVQFGNYTIAHDPLRYRTVTAQTPGGKTVGYLMWDKPADWNNHTPTISSVRVNKPQQRKGIATAMLEHARQYEPDLQHSHARTPDGRAWTQARP